MAARGRPPTHTIDRYRSLAWYTHLSKHSRLSDYALNKRFGPVHLDESERVRRHMFEKIRKDELPATVELVDKIEAELSTGSAEYFHAEFWDLLKLPDPSLRPLLRRADAFFSRRGIARIMPRDAKLFPKLDLPRDEHAAYSTCLDLTLGTLNWKDRATAICLLTCEARLAQNDFFTSFLYGRLQTILFGIFQEFLPGIDAAGAHQVAHDFLYFPSAATKDEEWLRWQAAGWVDRFLVPNSYLSPFLIYCPIMRKGCTPGVPCEEKCSPHNGPGTSSRGISVRPEWFDV